MDLHKEFVKLGRERNRLTYKLLELLPEIYRTGIYKKYAGTIVEYAGRFGGLSKGVVLKRLRLEKKLEDKPLLRAAIAKEGVHKVALVANLATPETEKVWVDKVENMSKNALQELSKEVRAKEVKQETSLFGDEKISACQAVSLKMTIELDEQMTFLFLKLKKQLKENNNQEVMKKILEMAEAFCRKAVAGARKEENEKQRVILEDNSSSHEEEKFSLRKISARYIPAKIKKSINQKSEGKCEYPKCNKPAEIFHHTERFAVSKNHDHLKHLCKNHHEFCHNGIVHNERTEKWSFKITEKTNNIDNCYREFRKTAIQKQRLQLF